MATLAGLISRVRAEIGDPAQPFDHQFLGDGATSDINLPVSLITQLTAKIFTAPATFVTLVQGTDYTLDAEEGWLYLTNPVAEGSVLLTSGHAASLFSDDELTQYVNDAFLQHTANRTIQTRYKSADGFIRYDEQPISPANLPEVEEPLVGLLATVEVLWALSTDAATDIDVQTAEGTNVNRGQRYRQLLQQIDLLTEKYQSLCAQLNVGLYRIEMSTLRRVSLTNNRLVPIFKAREYDENAYPTRLLPPIDHPNEDESGVPSQAIGGWW